MGEWPVKLEKWVNQDHGGSSEVLKLLLAARHSDARLHSQRFGRLRQDGRLEASLNNIDRLYLKITEKDWVYSSVNRAPVTPLPCTPQKYPLVILQQTCWHGGKRSVELTMIVQGESKEGSGNGGKDEKRKFNYKIFPPTPVCFILMSQEILPLHISQFSAVKVMQGVLKQFPFFSL